MEINSITVKAGRRAIDSAKVRELANSMSEIGLINPITVTQDRVLITGAHRLAAAKLLGWTDIQATVSELDGLRAELAEIDENLMRNELHYLDEGAAYKRRDELLDEMGARPKAGDNQYTVGRVVVTPPLKTTEELAAEMGVSKSTYKQAKQMAKDILPEVQDAIKAADLPKRDALKIARMNCTEQKEIASALSKGAETLDQAKLINQPFVVDKPHVAYNSGENEWYTPSELIEAARFAMGGIDLDPASSAIANQTVKATEYFDVQRNGLIQKWYGRVWMNPPYAAELIGKFADKVVQSYSDREIEQAIILVNNATETQWFQTLIGCASAIVFPRSRVRFLTPNGSTGAPLQGQAIVYIGEKKERFLEAFRAFGWGAVVWTRIKGA